MRNKKLVFVYCYTFFSLCVFTTGTIAWFAANERVTATGAEVKVRTSGCELADLHLYKFDYPAIEGAEEFIDFLHPENGEVNRYEYNREFNKFGYNDEDSFVFVDEMNLYDPIESLITGSKLIDLNTNVIYEIKLSFGQMGEFPISISAKLFEAIKNNESDILCSSCMDFNVFEESDLNNPSLTEDKYKPEYVTSELTEFEDVFYKVSYLTSISDSHANFYSDPLESNIVIYSGTIQTDEDGYATVYLNINYSPETLTSFGDIAGLQVINAVCDYRFIIESEENS